MSVYTEGEVTMGDVSLIRDYLDQFDQPVPVLLIRQSNYSLSFEVQQALKNEGPSRFKAFAYVERSPEDRVYSEMAEATYMRDVPVN
ncbi:hypothetical protein BOW51_12165 [Solemya velesiana gill symbiont]|uniref:Uncharacterized protein n=2 Tax=Solemya velesiana gill symbiont TaxID=1918948 RepID=A0A1T2KNE5_9GAMM|nr:hypothetical protein BOW51_12165 [Solemya velesiana gill symbiont]